MTSSPAIDVPSVTVELCLNGTGALTAAASWTDVTTYVRGFGVNGPSRDRDTGRFNGGSTTLILANRDRRFDPSYAAGPHFGNLKPRVQGRIRATWSAVTYPIAYFYVDGWPQALPSGMYDAEVPVTGSDGFRLLNSELPDSVWKLTLDDLAVNVLYRLDEQSGTIMGNAKGAFDGVYEGGATFNHRTTLLPYGTSGGAIEFDGLEMVGRTPSGVTTGNGDFTIAFLAKMPEDIPVGGASDIHPTLVRQDMGSPAISHGLWNLYIDPSASGSLPPGCLVFYSKAVEDSLSNPRYSDTAMVGSRTYFIAITYDTAGPTATMYLNGVAQSSSGAGFGSPTTDSLKNSIRIGGETTFSFEAWNGVIGEFAEWSSTLSASDISTLYDAYAVPWDGDASGTRVGRILDAVGFPASLRDLDAGLTTLGPAKLEGTALDYLQRIAQSEDGLLYMAPDGDVTFDDRTARRAGARFMTSAGTFSDRSGTLLYEDIVTSGWDDESIVNIGWSSRVGGTLQEYRDAASIAAYGEKPFDDTELFMATDGEALDRATHRVLLQKDPAFRVESITLRPRGNTALWPHALGRLVGDRVTIQLTPVGVTPAISTDCHISGISHQITDVYTAADGKTGFDWITIWSLEPADPLSSFWAVAGSGAAKNQVGTAKASY